MTPPQQQAVATAAAAAHTSGKPVAVDALTTETQQIVAEPNGGLELAANPSPVRTRQSGRWVPIDTTLHQSTNGMLTPAATAYGSVRFSGGGLGPLVSTTAGSTTYTLTWPAALPTPAVSGSVATYRNVLPGVDLQMSATPTGGFSDVLVVHTAAAAKNPTLATLTLSSKATGGQVNAGSDGTVTITGPRGSDILQSATPLMWDSNTTLSIARTSVPGQAKSRTSSTSSIGPDASDAEHPGLAARVAVVGTKVSGSSLSLTPNHGLLVTPSTVFPLYIDPTFSWHSGDGNNLGFDEVKQGSPCNHVSYYDNTTPDAGNSGLLGVGYQDAGLGCEGKEHTYYQWRLPTVLHGAIIHIARIDATKVWSASCVPTPVDLTWSRAIGSGTDWNNAPGPMTPRYSTSHTFAAAYNADHCPKNGDAAGSFDVMTPMLNSLRSNATLFTVELTENAAESQFNDLMFSRFSTGSIGTSLPVLHIEYNLAPRVPNNLSARIGGDNVGCATSTPYPYMGATTPGNPPVLNATVSDPDGDKLQATYKYWIDGSTTAAATGLSADALASGSDAQFSLPTSFTSGLTNGKVIDWQVEAGDGQTSSAWSPICHYIAEPTAPAQPLITSADGVYPNVDAGGVTGAHAGTPGLFTISAPSANTTQFVYGLDQPPTTVNPPSSQIVSTFSGGSVPGGLTDRWQLAGSSGSTATDPTGNHPATLSTSGATFAGDTTRGQVLSLDGVQGYAATARPVLNTAGSYSVSAWVKLTDTSTYQTAVSQGDAAKASFYLQYSLAANAWAFVSPSDDTTAPGGFPSAHATSPPALNTWTNLVGVFDAATGKMSLYVNGALAGTATNTSPWDAKGPLTIGGVKLSDGSSNNYFDGSISDVQTYSRALSASEVIAVQGGTPATGTLADHWSLSDGTGTAAGDPIGNHPATRSATGTSWTNDPHRGNVLALDGVHGYAATSAGVLSTDSSYSVSAWVNLANTTTYYTAVSQGGAHAASFYLQYSKATNAWSFVAPSSDATGVTQASAHATTAPALNTWTHLVGTFDATTDLMSLYVNGALVGTAANAKAWPASGPLAIGGVALTDGTSNNYFAGSISDVQTYTRALTASEITQMYTTATISITPPSPGPHTLSVYAMDAAGDVSIFADYDFVAGADSGGAPCASLTDCFDNTAISPDGNRSLGAYAATAGPVLNTAASYSVSAWVKIDNIGTYATAVSQGGTDVSGFYLQYSASANAWSYVAPTSDATGVAQVSAHGTTTPALHSWTHLVSVFDTSTHLMSLYVNGALAGTGTNTSPWTATGPLTIGGAKLVGGVTSNYFPGSISDVQTYARALTSADIATIYAGGVAATPNGRWALSDGSGTSAADPVGNHPATLSGSATWSLDTSRGKVLALGGATGADGANSFSAEDLTKAGWLSGGTVTVDGATFTLPHFGSGQNDNVLAANQTITWSNAATLPANSASQLVILAASTDPSGDVPDPVSDPTSIDPASQVASQAPYVPAGTTVSGSYCFDGTNPAHACAATGHVNYGSGLPSVFQLSVPDWISGPSSLAAVALPHENKPAGQVALASGPKIYAFSIQLRPGSTISSITLPDVSALEDSGVEALHIFGMAVRDTTTVPNDRTSGDSWTGAWGSPTEGLYNLGGASFSNQTFRVALKPSIAGGKVRIKLDNALGNVPLDIGAATIALDSGSGTPSPVPGSPFTALTFGASPQAMIPTGGMVYSDPISIEVRANQYVLVSFQLVNGSGGNGVPPAVQYLPEHTWSNTAWEYISAVNSGNLTADSTSTHFSGINGAFSNVLADLDVVTQGVGTTAVLGDGLIDAWQPNADPFAQADIAADLTADEPTSPTPYGTVSEGIESNQVMADDPESYNGRPVGGPSALSRIDRDILDQPGLTAVVLDEGLEDILANRVSADTLDTIGYTQLIGYLQAYGIMVIGIHLTPCEGYLGDGATSNDPCTPAMDANRVVVNGWLSGDVLGMGSTPFPGVSSYFYADTDAAVGTPNPNPDNAEVALDPHAAMPDHVNLTAAGFGALTSAYLGPYDTWPLNDPVTNVSDTTVATDTAQNDLPHLATNISVGKNDATLSGSATFAGDTNDAMHPEFFQMNGTPGAATTAGPVLATDESYTVSAWVKLPATLPTSDADIISQDGTNNSGFALLYDAGDQRWEFGMAVSDTSGAPTIMAKAQFAPTTGTWTHLVGSYNATTGAVSLFVNGAANGTATNTSPYATNGPLVIGRGQSNAAATGYFNGELSDIQAWNYTLTPTQIGALYQQIH